jgi:geranylgeranyl diphosphate synthase type I
MARYHLGWEDEQGNPSDATGKGLRSALCLLACEASGGEWPTAVPAASAVELVHAFSLVHDDIQDRDRERHHRPAVWTVWGEAQAINAGDALLALARLALARLAHDADTQARCTGVLDQATLEMVEGQTLDLEFEGSDDVSVDQYLDMVGRKTGALFGCSLSMGAIVAGAVDGRVQQFDRLGRTLGSAFQVRDDTLGIWGDETKTGKPAGADVSRHKKSLPVLLGLRGAKSEEIRRAYSEPEPSEAHVATIVRALEGSGVREECMSMARDMADDALAQLNAMELDEAAGSDFREAVTFLLERDF